MGNEAEQEIMETEESKMLYEEILLHDENIKACIQREIETFNETHKTFFKTFIKEEFKK